MAVRFRKLLAAAMVAVAFSAVVATEDEACGGKLSAGTPGYITSPGYPKDYPPHLVCRWEVQAPQRDQRISVTFNPHFDVEKTSECRFDYVEVRDGRDTNAEVLGKFCGNIPPSALVSSGPVLYIHFQSDYSTQGAGFSLRFEIQATDECSHMFTAPNGSLQSPGFPEPYKHNLECTYIIKASVPRSEIVLKFHTFLLEGDQPGTAGIPVDATECRYDRLEIWDGPPRGGPLLGRFCGAMSPGEVRAFSGILSLSFYTDGGIALDGFWATYRVIPRRIIESVQCNQPLGMESGKVEVDRIVASSTHSSRMWQPWQARLHNPINGWTPSRDDPREWIQVDLGSLKLLSGVATQGAVSHESQIGYFVSSFRLEVSSLGADWTVLRGSRAVKAFAGNVDATSVVENRLAEPVLTRFVRIRPQTWEGGIALRFELYGCSLADFPCLETLGVGQGHVPDNALSASSQWSPPWGAHAARLLAPQRGWAPHMAGLFSFDEWLQVDLGSLFTVRGVILQGVRGDLVNRSGNDDASQGTQDKPEGPLFVKKFRVGFSEDGDTWHMVTDDESSQPKIFNGSSNVDLPEMRKFEPVEARLVRVYPERWSPHGIGLRLELLGCQSLDNGEDEVDPGQPKKDGPPGPEPPYSLDNDPGSYDAGETIANYTEFHIPARSQDDREDGDGVILEGWGPGSGVPGFNCEFHLGADGGMCSWIQDDQADLHWLLGDAEVEGEEEDIHHDKGDGCVWINTLGRAAGERARLLSVPLPSHAQPRCLAFRYRLHGDTLATSAGVDSLRVLTRTQTPMGMREQLVWSLTGVQGREWRLAHAVLPINYGPYQVILEGEVGAHPSGSVAVDDIRIAFEIPIEDCQKPHISIVETDTTSGDQIQTEGTVLPELSLNRALDPILISVIIVSTMGVLLGAVCIGLLLCCAPARRAASIGVVGTRGYRGAPAATLDAYAFELCNGARFVDKSNGQHKLSSEA
ncbi:neuropilin-2 isoform X1 [Petromyzon marinus]|uniref:neuropilin-2 isoform X1 n=1 Tax=Petromyzon marinus TaxID=7757 RepID=UPI003F6FCE37